MISYGSKTILSAIYDVAADPNAGAIGTVKMGINLPGSIQPGSIIMVTGIWVTAVKTLTSAGAATLSFGVAANVNGTPTAEPTLLANANVLAAFNANVDAQGNFQPVQGKVGNGNPQKFYPSLPAGGGPITGWDVIMVIGTAALTAGKLQIILECNVTPQ